MASWFIWGPFRECARALSNTTNLSVPLLALSTRPRLSPWVMLFGTVFSRTSGASTSFPLGLGEQQYTTTTFRQLRSQTRWAPGSPFTSTGNKENSRAVFSASTPVRRMSNTSSPLHALVVLRTLSALPSLCVALHGLPAAAQSLVAFHLGTLFRTTRFHRYGPWSLGFLLLCALLRHLRLRPHFLLRRLHHLYFRRVQHHRRLHVRKRPWPHRGRGDMPLMAMAEVRAWLRVVV